MENIITVPNPELQSVTPTPEASGDQGCEKLFTQEDVNRIISDRLARERAKAEPSPEDAREADLRAREARLACREYISEHGYPSALLELLDTSDPERFRGAVEQLDSMASLPSKTRKPAPRLVAPTGSGGAPRDTAAALLEEAFKPPKI